MSQEGRIATIVIPALAALVGALLGAFGGYLGVRASIDGQLRLQDRQFFEQRERMSADRRGEVYASFMDAADQYANAAASLVAVIESNCNTGVEECLADPEVTDRESWTTYASARYAYQGALNDVYVWGSDSAVEFSRSVSESLPPSLGVVGGSGIEGFDDVDRESFTEAYRAFLAMMCSELPARPRDRC